MVWFWRSRAGGAARVKQTRPEPPRNGFAVRRNWPDGVHDFAGFALTAAGAGWFAVGDRRYWRKGPFRPVSYVVVAISVSDFELHGRRPLCKSPGCPDRPADVSVSVVDRLGVES